MPLILKNHHFGNVVNAMKDYEKILQPIDKLEEFIVGLGHGLTRDLIPKEKSDH
ncbi:hypothetical protein LCGC14_1730300 [marine sediment metagenome]|uniref:Uncharacterized protein n=1 Tax=marine sediment metagenome TaxID=412755 RepID=A0A0F9H9T9_9ZZZZ|nr:MAG: hypothetical protein Lokiarch_15610 [Candidatus Lokiarchaeum sp. GC14_75]